MASSGKEEKEQKALIRLFAPNIIVLLPAAAATDVDAALALAVAVRQPFRVRCKTKAAPAGALVHVQCIVVSKIWGVRQSLAWYQ